MTRDKAVQYVSAYYSGNMDVQSFLAEYAVHRGKTDLSMFEQFLALLVMSGAADGAIKYAVDYLIKECNICIIHKIDKQFNKQEFITAY